MHQAHPSGPEWAQQQAANLPARWRGQVLARWGRAANPAGADWMARDAAERDANIELRAVVEKLEACASASIPLDATDQDLCDLAERQAADAFALATAPHLRSLPALRQALAARCRRIGVEPPKEEGEKGRQGRSYEDGPAVARMTCAQWWRRQLRKLHARSVEGAAIRLGLVNRTRDLYVSNESLAKIGRAHV